MENQKFHKFRFFPKFYETNSHNGPQTWHKTGPRSSKCSDLFTLQTDQQHMEHPLIQYQTFNSNIITAGNKNQHFVNKVKFLKYWKALW